MARIKSFRKHGRLVGDVIAPPRPPKKIPEKPLDGVARLSAPPSFSASRQKKEVVNNFNNVPLALRKPNETSYLPQNETVPPGPLYPPNSNKNKKGGCGRYFLGACSVLLFLNLILLSFGVYYSYRAYQELKKMDTQKIIEFLDQKIGSDGNKTLENFLEKYLAPSLNENKATMAPGSSSTEDVLKSLEKSSNSSFDQNP